MWPKAALETDLVAEKAKHGDIPSFEKLYALYKRPVYVLCLRLTRDVVDAEDLTQEVFMQVYRKVSGFRGEAAFGSWLYKVAINVSMMHLRKLRRSKELQFDESKPDTSPRPGALPGGSHHQCDPIERISLLRALLGLSKDSRALVILHDLNGFTHSETAQYLGTNANTGKSQLHRAHRELRDILTGEGHAHSATKQVKIVSDRG